MKTYRLKLNNTIYEVDVELVNESADMSVTAAPAAPAPAPAAPVAPAPAAPATPAGGEEVVAPLPGTVLDIKVAVGAQVQEGDIVAILEAMKMENEIFAPCSGTVTSVVAAKGTNVNTGDCLLVLS